jgi:hypothetical protein
MTADPPSVLELARSLAGYITHRKIAHDGQALHPACPLMSLRSTPSGVPQPKRKVSEEGTGKSGEREFTPDKYDARLEVVVPITAARVCLKIGGCSHNFSLPEARHQHQYVAAAAAGVLARRSIVWIKNNPSRGNCHGRESFRDPEAETDDGVGLNCSIAQFRSFIATRLGFTAEPDGRLKLVAFFSRGFCCHRIPSSS